MPMLAIVAGVSFILTFLITLLISRINLTAGKIAAIAITSIGVCLYIQGNFLQASYDKLGGETIDWSNYTGEGISNVCGWIGMIAILAVILYKVHMDGFIKAFKTVLICILLVQITTLVVVGITRHGLMHKDDYVATNEHECELSSGTNFIILCMDTFDSRLFDDLLHTDKASEYKEMLEDFTYYRNTLTVFTLTDFSIPQILTGEKYLNQEDYGPFIEHAYAESPFLNRLHDDGYAMDIYTTITLPQEGAREWMENWHKIDYVTNNPVALIQLYYRLVAFRYAPHYLKAPFVFDIDNFDDYKQIGTIDGHVWSEDTDPKAWPWSNVHFIDSIPNMTVSDNGKIFRFYHIKGVHHTRELDEHLNEVTDLGEDGEGVSLGESAKANAEIINRFLARLKKIGAYDNSVIVILADHGATRYKGGGMIQCPLLLVKGRGEKHGFDISEAPISYDDLQDGFDSLLNGGTDGEVFKVKEGDERTRTMYYTGFIGQRRRFTRNEPFIEYQTNGHSFETYLLRETGIKY